MFRIEVAVLAGIPKGTIVSVQRTRQVSLVGCGLLISGNPRLGPQSLSRSRCDDVHSKAEESRILDARRRRRRYPVSARGFSQRCSLIYRFALLVWHDLRLLRTMPGCAQSLAHDLISAARDQPTQRQSRRLPSLQDGPRPKRKRLLHDPWIPSLHFSDSPLRSSMSAGCTPPTPVSVWYASMFSAGA